ncbi:peroxisomal membrane protein 11A [Strongylocentrotus purpuratus]|uniref:Peroxisomal membrane protein 11A n=1 Tax=Strongylocentrotus purpuratus TaxID=7668 RepID=A0A7M7RDZ9_STRPU|nr:peroxisomal membrane protein 11A [Strongylocentrotus purpuratus]|eukprot:XP_780011.1 PREDICTED: peroxisomal membrane protein 11A [Strongylocentrotus purpuratus]
MAKQTRPSEPIRDLIKYLSYTEGRDKIYRITQYTTRFLLWYYGNNKASQFALEKIQNLESTVSNSRKLFRMLRSVEFLQRALDALASTDNTEASLQLIGYLGKSLWLLTDHVVWMHKIKLFDVNIKKWSETSARFWLIGLLALTIKDLYKLQKLSLSLKELKRAGEPVPRQRLESDITKARLQFILDFSDVFIPLAALGYVNKGVGAGGGIIASVIGLYLVWQKTVPCK